MTTPKTYTDEEVSEALEDVFQHNMANGGWDAPGRPAVTQDIRKIYWAAQRYLEAKDILERWVDVDLQKSAGKKTIEFLKS